MRPAIVDLGATAASCARAPSRATLRAPALRAVASAGFDGGANKPLPHVRALPASSPLQASPAGVAAPGAPTGALAALRGRERPLFLARDVILFLVARVWAFIPVPITNAVIRRVGYASVVRRRVAEPSLPSHADSQQFLGYLFGLFVSTVLLYVVELALSANVVAQESCGRVAARGVAFLTRGLVDPLKAEREAVEAEAAALPVEVHLRRAGGPSEQPLRVGWDPASVAVKFFPRSTPQSELLAWA